MTHPGRRLCCALILTSLTCVAIGAAGGPGTQAPLAAALQSLFERYRAGADIHVASARLVSATPAREIRREVQRLAREWPVEPATAFILEIAGPSLARPDADAGDLVTLACALAREKGRPGSRRPWHLATLAVLTGALSDRPGLDSPAVRWRREAAEHYHRHSRPGLGEDGEHELLWGRNREAVALAMLAGWGPARRLEMAGPLPSSGHHDIREALEDAAEAFDRARIGPAIGAEATARPCCAMESLFTG